MFTPRSRYYNIATVTHGGKDGRVIAYVRRRFVPRGDGMPTLVEVESVDGSRLDLITGQTLGDPEQYWRVCDANNAMNPAELIASPGRRIRVPIPQFEGF